MDAVTVVSAAGNHAAQEDNVVVPFFDCDRVVTEPKQVFLKLRQLLVVRGKSVLGPAFGVTMQMLDDDPCD